MEQDGFHVMKRTALQALLNQGFNFRLMNFNGHGVLSFIHCR